MRLRIDEKVEDQHIQRRPGDHRTLPPVFREQYKPGLSSNLLEKLEEIEISAPIVA